MASSAIVCVSKKEYLHPHRFGYGYKETEVLGLLPLAGLMLIEPDQFPSWWRPAIAGRWPDMTIMSLDEVQDDPDMQEISNEFRVAIEAANTVAREQGRSDWVKKLGDPLC